MNLITNDPIRPSQMQTQLPSFFKLLYFEEIDSTNTYLKQHTDDLNDGTVCIANYQTGGKGRNGRSFFSPKGSGLYMSILVKPEHSLANMLSLTAILACAVVKAIAHQTGIQASIKWLNDLQIQNKKVAGILCESSMQLSGKIDAMILGIGINVHSCIMPDEISQSAGALSDFCSQSISRQSLACAILKQFYAYYKNMEEKSWVNDYRSYCSMLSKRIEVHHGNKIFQATALDINDEGALWIEAEGERILLSSGEIHVCCLS